MQRRQMNDFFNKILNTFAPKFYNMNFLELMKHRYTTKKYKPNYKINQEKIEELKQILNLSPSSINSQPWKFIFIDDQDIKNRLSEFSFHNKERVQECSHVVVFNVINDVKHFENQISKHLPEGAVNYYKTFLQTKSETEIKTWLQNQVYISLGVFLTACASMEIDATPMEGIMNEKYSEILGLENYKTVFAVCIGKRDEEDTNQPSKTPKRRIAIDEVVEENI